MARVRRGRRQRHDGSGGQARRGRQGGGAGAGVWRDDVFVPSDGIHARKGVGLVGSYTAGSEIACGEPCGPLNV